MTRHLWGIPFKAHSQIPERLCPDLPQKFTKYSLCAQSLSSFCQEIPKYFPQSQLALVFGCVCNEGALRLRLRGGEEKWGHLLEVLSPPSVLMDAQRLWKDIKRVLGRVTRGHSHREEESGPLLPRTKVSLSSEQTKPECHSYPTAWCHLEAPFSVSFTICQASVFLAPGWGEQTQHIVLWGLHCCLLTPGRSMP